MTKYIALTLSAWIIFGISLCIVQIAFSQAIKDTNNEVLLPVGTSSYVKGITPGRANALIGVVAGLISLTSGVMARRRNKKHIGPGKGKNGAVVSLIFGLIGITISIIHLSTSAGAVFGSGSGKAGAIFAIIVSLIGLTLSLFILKSKKL